MINLREITKKILWLGIEDYSGLWEILWDLKTQDPLLSEGESYEMARDALQTSIKEGYLKLYRCQEPYGELTEIPSEQAYSLVQDPKNWQEPQANSLSLRIGTTETGQEIYRGLT